MNTTQLDELAKSARAGKRTMRDPTDGLPSGVHPTDVTRITPAEQVRNMQELHRRWQEGRTLPPAQTAANMKAIISRLENLTRRMHP